jgi:hypothetical protein
MFTFLILKGRFGRTNKALRKQLGLEEEGAESKTADVTSKISAATSATLQLDK